MSYFFYEIVESTPLVQREFSEHVRIETLQSWEEARANLRVASKRLSLERQVPLREE